MTHYQKIIIGVFLLIALTLRISAALRDDTTFIDRGDAHGYDQIAMSLAHGKGYRFGAGMGPKTAWCTPLYPLFLAAIYRTVGHSYHAVRMVQAILSTATVLLIVLWAYTLFGGVSACLAAVIASVYPAFYAYSFSSTSIATETLYLFLFIAAFLTLSYYWVRPSWLLATVSGLLWGLSNLTRPMTLFLFPLLPFILIYLRYPVRLALRYCGMVWFLVALTFAPWMIRNYLAFHTFVPVITNTGANLFTGYHPENDGLGGFVFDEIYFPEQNRLESLGLNEAERANYFFRKGLELIRAYPFNALRLFVRRTFLYMDPRTTLNPAGNKRQIVTWGYLFVLAGAVLAFLLSLRYKIHRREILFLCLIFGYFILFHGLIGASERYRFPNESFLIILTSFALSFLPIFRRKNSKEFAGSEA